MSIYIHATADTIIKYPFSRSDLLATFPNVSFPSIPAAEDLAPLDVYPLSLTPRPADTRDERAVEDEPALIDGTWYQTWRTRPATADEIAAYDRDHAPAPDWVGFATALAMHPAIATLYESLPLPVSSGLSVSLSRAASGDADLFVALWTQITTAGLMTETAAAVIAAEAERYHLPAALLAVLKGEESIP